MRWHRLTTRAMVRANLTQTAQMHEVLVQVLDRLAYRAAAADTGPPHPLLLAALDAPSRRGDVLPLEVRGHQFLAVTGPGDGDPETIWAVAAGLALSAGTPGVPPYGRHEVSHIGYRVFPPGLWAVGVPSSGEELRVWLNTDASGPEQRIAVRKVSRPGPGHRRSGSVAVPTAGGALLLSTAAVVAGMHAAARPPARAAVPPSGATVPATAAPWRAYRGERTAVPIRRYGPRRRGRDRDSSPAGQFLRSRASEVPTPVSAPNSPAPTPVVSPSVLPSPGGPVLPHHRTCVWVLGKRFCVRIPG